MVRGVNPRTNPAPHETDDQQQRHVIKLARHKLSHPKQQH
jgi:hypothetical protein